MSIAALMDKARAMGVRLILNGDGVKLRGPAVSVAEVKRELADYKAEVVSHLRRAANDFTMSSYPLADGPYLPYVVPMPAEQAAELTSELRTVIGKLADMERWTEAQRAELLALITRQPLSTVADDLAYFRARLNAIEVVARAAMEPDLPE
ncbi:hypothetical protein LMG18102_01131 [Ralstonia mannitolilytica]|uniref:hypothetical protein n=1 Tax=Ralstonia mannitolilytica TaxID=105219 RepID=UPI0028F52799|nr:hypothetical protein [Ralstonia mannitolilytica]CAJ0689565.1 hypothetical protein LMG18102_01131 [Ralstonia mannitolilytica]